MPARSKVPNPEDGPLQQFAYDLRVLGRGKASIPVIAEHSDCSRAALYAALSGTRLPSAKTLSTLLRWWVGDALAEREDLDGESWEPPWPWRWVNELPDDHPNHALVETWMYRHYDLEYTLADRRLDRPQAAAVEIPVPAEQGEFIGRLYELLSPSDGSREDWWAFYSPVALKRINRYLAGESLPQENSLFEIVRKRAIYGVPPIDYEEAAQMQSQLENLAGRARAARARDRRLARIRQRAADGSS